MDFKFQIGKKMQIAARQMKQYRGIVERNLARLHYTYLLVPTYERDTVFNKPFMQFIPKTQL